MADNATHDAWVIGTHDLPPHIPMNVSAAVSNLRMLAPEEGFVVVHERGTQYWVTVDLVTFDQEYEWV